MSFVIRSARPDDAKAIAKIHAASWNTRYQNLSQVRLIAESELPQQEARWLRRIEGDGRGRFILVAEDAASGAVVGLLSAGPCRSRRLGYGAEIYAVYVAPWLWRNRLGLRLMASAAQRLRLFGHRNLMLWTLEDNDAGRAFYERLGGAVIGGMVEHYEDAALREIGYGWDRLDGLIAVCAELHHQS